MSVSTLSVLSTLWLAAVEAPITSVTVYGDQARVVRSAKVTLSGPQRLELPRLYGAVDGDSIRVEAQGAEVSRVEVRPVTSEPLPTGEARRLITELERIEDQLTQVRAEQKVYVMQIAWLGNLLADKDRREDGQEEERREGPAAKSPPGALPRLDASGWRAATDFVGERSARLQAKLRELTQRMGALNLELTARTQEAQRLGVDPSRRALEVTPTLVGQGPATLTLTYVTRNARWYPAYELRLDPESNRVAVAFSGRVSQETGEDWENAALTLSTALPSQATRVPELTTWKIGQRERFIPTPAPVSDSWRAPPPASPPPPQAPDEEARLRSRLLALAASSGRAPPPPPPPPPAPPPGMAYQAPAEAPMPEYSEEEREVSDGAPSMGQAFELSVPAPVVQGGMASTDRRGGVSAESAVGLAPPASWRRPAVHPDLPAALSGGHALSFPAQRRETVHSGKGERRVPLFTESWPVQVERDLYPALTPNAFLVAQLRGPSTQVLPGGEAQLFVGADPAGQARLSVVAPGEPFTLPLGVDPAVRPVRNVQVVTAEKGFIGKKDVTDYLVTLEVANPYPVPLALRLHDQWPLSRHQDVEVTLVRTEPAAERDEDQGTLLWRLTVPPAKKTSVSFLYTVRHPKGWRLTQSQ